MPAPRFGRHLDFDRTRSPPRRHHHAAERQPAVGEHGLPGHEARLVGGQEHDYAREILGRRESAERRRSDGDLDDFFVVGEEAGDVAFDQRGGRGVHADVQRRELHGEIARQRLQRGLGRADDDVVGRHEIGADRGQVDDAAAAAPRHQRRSRPGAPEAPFQVDVQRACERVFVDLRDGDQLSGR